ncbi:hypothetical protein DFH08DRAFT_366593 [Mycena albidolilacea]|uniref:Uncharacterized protein n=1 Tax=Mycena albidolilacea TaxID=1033008 RepID=A0AAD7F2B0_9AGAR|nr:hypothetical protein DFH08DRAFT_366593 [Mycena albidolilacea]
MSRLPRAASRSYNVRGVGVAVSSLQVRLARKPDLRAIPGIADYRTRAGGRGVCDSGGVRSAPPWSCPSSDASKPTPPSFRRKKTPASANTTSATRADFEHTNRKYRCKLLPSAAPPADAHRFSLVLALRPALDARISTASFAQSPLIGPFPPARLSAAKDNFPHCSMYARPARELWDYISAQQRSVNNAPEEREAQKRKWAFATASSASLLPINVAPSLSTLPNNGDRGS